MFMCRFVHGSGQTIEPDRIAGKLEQRCQRDRVLAARAFVEISRRYRPELPLIPYPLCYTLLTTIYPSGEPMASYNLPPQRLPEEVDQPLLELLRINRRRLHVLAVFREPGCHVHAS